jgi:hypothetical protein
MSETKIDPRGAKCAACKQYMLVAEAAKCAYCYCLTAGVLAVTRKRRFSDVGRERLSGDM